MVPVRAVLGDAAVGKDVKVLWNDKKDYEAKVLALGMLINIGYRIFVPLHF